MHAYLIMAHNHPGQLRKLLEMLDDERNAIFVHIDKKATFDRTALQGCCFKAQLHVLAERKDIRWGDLSQIMGELLLLETATQMGQFDYYHLLSGADLPIKSQDEIHRFFDAHPHREWMLSVIPTGRFRLRFETWTLFPRQESKLHTLNSFCSKVQHFFGVRRHRDIDFRHGANWFSIDDDFARYVLTKKTWIQTIFRGTILCDEIFLQTILQNSPFQSRLENNNLRLIDWGRRVGGHPHTWRISDKELILNQENVFWARKFDESVDPEIIDLLYLHLTQKAGD